MKQRVLELIPGIDEAQAERLELYYELLTDWNTRMNLTAISEKEEVAQKHFADSALGSEFIERNASLIDVGTGAGFPGVVLKIVRPDIRLTLLDSLQKRIGFLEELCKRLELRDVVCVHARAEDGARDVKLRERFDHAAARAVAGIPFLAEWLIPYLKTGGEALLYKGPQAEEELKGAKSAMEKLHCSAVIKHFDTEWGERNIVLLKKNASTDKKYPRKAGTKTPL